MGESGACLMHAFSYASGVPNEAKQENHIGALGGSVSFGRFNSEVLSWEKWSTFSHKRYVEEAERYARPGSVAQKKAFFEAYYKTIAAKKAAALLEQANAASEPESQDEDSAYATSTIDEPEAEVNLVNANARNPEAEEVVKTEGTDTAKPTTDVPLDQSEDVEAEASSKVREVKAAASESDDVLEIPSVDESLITRTDDLVDEARVSEELTGTPLMEKPLLKNSNYTTDVSSTVAKKKPVLSSIKSSVRSRSTKVQSSPAKSLYSGRSKKENNVTPFTNSKQRIMDQKRTTPKKSLRSLFSPPEETQKPKTSANRKIESSKVAPSSYPLRTPPMVKVDETTRTPYSEINGMKTPIHPAVSGKKTTGPKWHMLPASCAKSLSACRNKLKSPTLFSPFLLRTEERASRRKQKLEEKFNARAAAAAAQKVDPQRKKTEKPEPEHRKVRPSFCFKARPLPDFYGKKNSSENQMKKIPAAHKQPQSPKTERKTNVGPSKNRKAPPPPPPPPVTSSTKKTSVAAPTTKSKKSSRSVKSRPEKATSHENTSPNIQRVIH